MDISWVSHGPGEADTGSNNGTARLVTIPSLRLGARYTATIMDLAAEDNLVSFTFSACKCKSPNTLLNFDKLNVNKL